MATTRESAAGEPRPLRPVPDLQDTPVEDAQGRTIGHVYGSLAEAESGLIRYLDVALRDTDRHVLVPIGHARVDHHDGRAWVRLRAATREDLEEIPPYEPHATDLDGPYQQAVLAAHGRIYYGDRYYAHPAYDHSGLYAGEHPITREPAVPPAPLPLAPLSTLPGYRVVPDEPDIRGWPLLTGDGKRAGEVRDLMVDTRAERVRYVVAALEARPDEVLIPVGLLQIDRDAGIVRAPALTEDDLRALPPYRHQPLTLHDEQEILRTLEAELRGERLFERADFHA